MGGNPPKLKVLAVEADAPGWLTLLRQHFTWYPLMQLQDMYKLLYQGIMGPEHLAPTRQDFTRQLQAEYGGIMPNPHQPLLEPIHADRNLFRLNLRAFKALQISLDPVVSLFLDTFGLTFGTQAELMKIWRTVVSFFDRGQLEMFSISEVQEYDLWLLQKKYPAVHHSDIYRRKYQPSYRLLSAKFIPLLGVTDAI